MRTLARILAAGFAAIAVSFPLLGPPAASAATSARPLPCHASMSNSQPDDYTTTSVRVKTVAEAKVKTVAYYRTVTRVHHGRANENGRASIPYYISGATPGYQVIVDVYVNWPRRSGRCQTSFTPQS
jgi:hypothetical protein